MALEELIDFGFEVSRPPADSPIQQTTIWGHGQQWWLNPGDDEEALVQKIRNWKTLDDKMTQAQQYFQDNYANWGSMTAQQKDAANRQAQRGLANLIRHVRADLTTEGI